MQLNDVHYLEVVCKYEDFDREGTTVNFRNISKCRYGRLGQSGPFQALSVPNNLKTRIYRTMTLHCFICV
jgi:hypothetical protein